MARGKVAVIGANGQLGKDICSALNSKYNVIPLVHKKINIADYDSLKSVLLPMSLKAVINAAAYHHVDQCETFPVTAFNVNGLGPRNLASVCNTLNAIFVHISTDYVFNGNKASPYVEDDLAMPLNIYGSTKLTGEHFVQNIARKYFIIRTSALYGMNKCRAKGSNFVEVMQRLAGDNEREEVRVVDSEIVSPTYTKHLARQIARLLKTDRYGLYHATSEGECSWYEFAQEIFALLKLEKPLNIAAPDEFPNKTARPAYSVLENRELKKYNINEMGHWKDALAEYINDVAKRDANRANEE